MIRFDNRDIGRSTHLSGAPPTVGQLLTRSPRGARYLLADMAEDAAGLLRELSLAPGPCDRCLDGRDDRPDAGRAPPRRGPLAGLDHVEHRRRLTGQPSLRVYPALLRPPSKSREAFIERMVGVFELIGSPGVPRDAEEIRELAGASYDRDHDPAGPGRQLGAIVASGNRTEELRRITAPTLVIHGTADRLSPPRVGGRPRGRSPVRAC